MSKPEWTDANKLSMKLLATVEARELVDGISYKATVETEGHSGTAYAAAPDDALSRAFCAFAESGPWINTTSYRPNFSALGAWQPIETAPKDGTDVLLYEPQSYAFAPLIITGNWDEAGKGWYDNARGSYMPDPTHWMPLPEPPEPHHAE